MSRKAPRRTAERILETALEMFNRFGEPHVSTTAISAELRISPGNLYYHYPAKDELVNALLQRHRLGLEPLLSASSEVHDVEDAWFFMHALFEGLWHYRFIYRNLNDLLSRNRQLESQLQNLIQRLIGALQNLLDALRRDLLQMDRLEVAPAATRMTVLLTYWLSFEYVCDPRRALEPEHAQAALLRGATHVLGLLAPYMQPAQRAHLQQLAADYRPAKSAG
ncbi:MAG: TetR/AcrR family transcriptional regulator [Betaproteobacteria bacterium]